MSAAQRTRSAWITSLALLAGPLAAQDGLNLSLDLPAEVSWRLAAEQLVGESYSREWVPTGEEPDSASWLITQQKVPVDGQADAEDFLRDIYELSANACTSATHDEIERVRIDGIRGAVGRTMCGHRIGTDYGAFSDRAIFVEAGFAYVVTSELRIAPMIVDGVLSFGDSSDPSARAAKNEFIAREESSYFLVREDIHIN
jgi:hypothetical protein